MARCGCTNPCPPCPQAVYLDMMDDATTPVTLDLTAAPTVFNLIERQITIAAGLPGFGFTALGEWNAGAGGDQNELTASWAILLDGAVVQSRTKLNWQSDEYDSLSVFAGRNNLAPGVHTIVLQLTAAMEFGTGELIIFGAAMRTELVRADNLVITGGV